MSTNEVAQIAGRALVAVLFISAGVAKVLAPQSYLDHMTEFGVPIVFFPAVIALELGAGLALLVGFRVRETAIVLGLFCILTAVIFHRDLGDKIERTSFAKDLAIAGGLISMAVMQANRRPRPLQGKTR